MIEKYRHQNLPAFAHKDATSCLLFQPISTPIYTVDQHEAWINFDPGRTHSSEAAFENFFAGSFKVTFLCVQGAGTVRDFPLSFKASMV